MPPTTPLEYARAYLAAGLAPLPVKGDGSKEPDLPAGHDVLNRRRRATEEELAEWLRSGFRGVAVLGGPISGDLECIDFDRADLFAPWLETVREESPSLADTLTVNKTPRGWHVCYRCPGHVQGNQDLARELDAKAPPERPRPKTTIQTRGSGGYFLAPGCPACCHETGKLYAHHAGPSLADVRTITQEDRELLLDCARLLTTWTPPERPRPAHTTTAATGDRPGDDFNARADWKDILEPHGWTFYRQTAGTLGWTRPAKARGVSATTGLRDKCGKDLLHVFTSNAYPFEPDQSYDKFAAFALLSHDGDFSAAGKALLAAGWGEPSQRKGNILFPTPTAPTQASQAPAAAKVEKVVGQQMATVEFFRHDALLDADLPPLRWVVDGLIPDEGLTLLGGKKKLGKSWLCLQIAQAVASGQTCLDKPVSAGKVLYICLEDGKRRLRARLIRQHARRGLDVVYVTRFPKIDNVEGMARLMELIEEHRPRLLILDTLAAAKTGKVEENAAGPMGDLGNTLRAIAQHYGLGILATHHHGKLTGGDPGDDLRGSSALAAAADVNLGLYKGEHGYSIKGEGRDIEALDIPVRFDSEQTWGWMLPSAGSGTSQRQDATDQAILQALRGFGEADAESVASAVQLSRRQVADRLNVLAALNQLFMRSEPNGRGRPKILYRLQETV